MQKTAKEVDDHLKKIIKIYLKDNKQKELVEEVFESIADCPSHPLLDVIECSIQALMANISRIGILKKSENSQIAAHIKTLVVQTASELKEQIANHFHIKKSDELTPFVEGILFELCFDSVKDIFIKKEEKNDERYELQIMKLGSQDLGQVLHLEPPKYPKDSLDIVFDRSLKTIKMLEEVTTLLKARELIVKLHKTIIEDMAKYNNGQTPIDFATDDFINVIIFLILRSHVKNPFGMTSLLDGFMTNSDDCSEFGFSMFNLQIGVKTIINKL
ncbi:hypothetical protein EDI_093210 [Entamoeba dispar SAW760]|uniref:VPS9 domain-containing protein n=1 Tax=Entamoeba dispar (strain ATCC PRA-260 / SAW760) TaxID=370354 RepID=B0EDB3_ENTDS|nr:uncharacterized protein EDI_093210 [Entamoeba dispar SAW760]EDR27530.1 hypothetical protein EDI_093210 [Entamoeba dispar SAW760]|eukprot:EDR27530.1 hypothetical protein EDI_093210 [Entamoeba dispar SAW760]